MSTTGLYSGIYVQLREFGELVDEVLMKLKGGGSLYNQKRGCTCLALQGDWSTGCC